MDFWAKAGTIFGTVLGVVLGAAFWWPILVYVFNYWKG